MLKLLTKINKCSICAVHCSFMFTNEPYCKVLEIQLNVYNST